MPIGTSAYTLLGLTAIVAALVAIVVFAMLRFMAAARATRHGAAGGSEMAVLSAALSEAVAQLKMREQATATRAAASERLSSEIISSLTAGLVVVGMRNDIRILNPAGRRLLVIDAETPLDDYRRALPEALSQMIDAGLNAGVPIMRRTLKLEASRGATHLGVTVSPLRDEGGALLGAIALFSDLTAVRDFEDQLRLKDGLAAVGELSAGIAHEFRNGLATIQGYSKLIDLESLPEREQVCVQHIRHETESLSQIVTNFLNFARPAHLTLSRIELDAVCVRAAEEIRSEARALGGDVEVRGQFGAVEGDEVLLRQAFSNLLRNALEACAHASVAPVVVIESVVDVARQVSRVSVNDNGPGIELEARERIFHPFQTFKRGGTGLGLALVQKIIVFHNGRVAAGSSPQGGASLQVTLPLAIGDRDPIGEGTIARESASRLRNSRKAAGERS